LVFKIGFCNFAPLNLILTVVNRLKEYHIQFVGLEPGNHQFEFEVNDSFFEHFEFSQIQHAKIHIEVALEKMERMMVFTIGIEGEAVVTCDRCTEEFNFPISDSQRLIVKLGAEYMEESEDVVVIPETDYKFDLSSYIYEFIHLALPARLLHPDDKYGNSTCDPEMLRLLETLSSAGDSVDPRWEALKKLNTDQ
jgi:uncharacterized metal-binding protein YceD (DUF177 family)